MRIVFIGPPGSGKGTQAKIISEKLKLPHVSTGDLFRSLKGELKKRIEEYLKNGQLVPDELTIKILKKRISEPDCKNGFILDGFPRNLNQAKLLERMVKIDKIFFIDIDDEIAVNRISSRVSCGKCGAVYNFLTNPPKNKNFCDRCGERLYRRSDDNPEAIRKRLEVYHKETDPVLKFYKDRLIRINGELEIEKITEGILKEQEN